MADSMQRSDTTQRSSKPTADTAEQSKRFPAKTELGSASEDRKAEAKEDTKKSAIFPVHDEPDEDEDIAIPLIPNLTKTQTKMSKPSRTTHPDQPQSGTGERTSGVQSCMADAASRMQSSMVDAASDLPSTITDTAKSATTMMGNAAQNLGDTLNQAIGGREGASGGISASEMAGNIGAGVRKMGEALGAVGTPTDSPQAQGTAGGEGMGKKGMGGREGRTARGA
ncbi:hypothetical protein VTI74DRAFT_8471 [Chaetomium olivicolor]